MINCFYDCYNILNKVYSEKAFIKQAISSTVIEEKNRALTVKICYGVLDKDIELTYYIGKLTQKSPKLAVRTILKIAMYNIKYLGKKPYAVLDNAVELTKKLGKGAMSGFVNAFLRKFLNSKIEFPEELLDFFSVKYSYPKFAVEALLKKYNKERVEKIISAENTQNTLVFYDIDGKNYLDNLKITYNSTPFKNVFSVNNFTRNSDYDKGVYTFQALGSVAICDVVDSCDKLLDCCAAPGGKSVRLSYKCNSVTSFDVHQHRVGLIEDYAIRMGRKNIKFYVNDSKVYDPKYEQFFDAVLCDAPCSGIGVINDNPDIKLNKSQESIKKINKEQFSILINVANYVKVGGYLYYSTCSILDDENIEIINKFLSNNKNFEICPIESSLPHENVMGTNLFLPDISGGLGFYVAKLKRVN